MNEQQLIKIAKPYLFNTAMVHAIQTGKKTVTRRLIKPRYTNTHLEMRTDKYGTRLVETQNEEPGITIIKQPDGTTTHKLLAFVERMPPCITGDILYVRETWRVSAWNIPSQAIGFAYKDSICGSLVHIEKRELFERLVEQSYRDAQKAKCSYDRSDFSFVKGNMPTRWRPAIHMPADAARIFLRVTNVRAERIQDINGQEILAEGVDNGFSNPTMEKRWENMQRMAFADLWNSLYSKPQQVKTKGVLSHYVSYPWEDVQEVREYNGLKWYVYGNPWVHSIAFEKFTAQISK